MRHLLRKILLVSSLVCCFATTSYANLACVINGDFSPFPWSDETMGEVLNYEWPLINPHNKVTSKILIESANVYFTNLPVYIVKEYSLDDKLLSLGTAWASDEKELEVKFKTYKINDAQNRFGSMRIKFGTWHAQNFYGPHDQSLVAPPYRAPLKGLGFSPQLRSQTCPGFIASDSGEVFGLIIEKNDNQGSEYPDVFFSFEPL